MDDADLADKIRETVEAAQEKNRRRFSSPESLAACEACGEEIPLLRRQAAPGCTRCIWCQQRAERG